jgi:F-type H+-transporting ATPase subunit b
MSSFALESAQMLLSAASVEVDLNLQLVLGQFILISSAVIVLKPMLFDPLLSLYKAREDATDGAREKARDWDTKAAEILRKYDKVMEQVHREATEIRDGIRADALKLEASKLAKTHEETAKLLEDGRSEIMADIAKRESELDEEVKELANEIASRVIGREIKG